jgi:hypothetical protein
MATLKLTGSVGTGRPAKGLPHNTPADIIRVRDRFVELGFDWVKEKVKVDRDFTNLIKLFQSIFKGNVRVSGGDGRIDRHGNTHRWLAAANAPGWVNMHRKRGFGWEVVQVDHNNSYATTWMEERLARAGMQYYFMSFLPDSAPMWVRDFSRMKGGKTAGHGTHQTGLNVDMRLPIKHRLDYDHDLALSRGENDKRYDDLFDVDAARSQLKSIKAQMNVRNILFNDEALRKEKLCISHPNHGGHYHITIRPPNRIDGIYK